MGIAPISFIRPQDSAVSPSGGIWFSESLRMGREMFVVVSKTIPEFDRASSMSTEVANVIALLESWRDEDAQEQRETLNYLMKALDEDRPSSRKLFA